MLKVKIIFKKNFFLFNGKLLNLSEEKVFFLGQEPVKKFFPSARFKSENNLVLLDTVFFTRLMIPGILFYKFYR